MVVGSALSDAEVAVRAARAGAAVARARFGTESRRIDHAGVDFTTEADIEAERAIRAVLTEHRPEDGILGEELGASGDSSRRWLVDPICGTLNFAAGVPLFAVNVALEIGGVTAAAAVADPAAGNTFWTDGVGAWRAEDARAPEPGRAIAPSSSSRLVTVNLESRYPGSIGTRLLFDETFRERFSPRCLSTTLALSWVATGQQAGYITGGDLRHSVHWAAGIALCRAAGAIVTNLAGGELHTGEHGLVAAADAGTHELLLATLDTMR
ncbi:inositol monophosphatase family protein [Agromyces sp. Marseille-Q5079]|uniref:inositol monophosphatase family protein n=1 Tax=Agromyces sp. Marseille-Q5079 TaxID=3439059 RepID=UPI003D9C87FF